MLNINIIKPDDWHVHFRDNDLLANTVNDSAKNFSRALVMPNLIEPLTSIKTIQSYRQRIIKALKHENFTPYMTFYLNEDVCSKEFMQIDTNDYILGAKLYPKGATTNSSHGASSITKLYPYFAEMQNLDLVLQIHGEVTHGDIFAREAIFIKENLIPLIKNFPRLRIVLEHISSKNAVDFIISTTKNIAATITPHHLLYNRNNLLASGIRPHYYCLPILKKASDQKALIQAAISGNPKFFAGTDSAPHSIKKKENACGCAGIYSSPYAISFYTEVFDKTNSLSKLENFLSVFGATFYNLPIYNEKIELIRKKQVIPLFLPLGNEKVVPLGAGETLHWSIRQS